MQTTPLALIGSLDDHYHFHHSKIVKRSTFTMKGEHNFIHMDPKVNWIQQQVVKTRVKRYTRNDFNFIHFNDPRWSNMWYIHCGDKSNRCRSEMNILAAWQRGYTGKNVVVTILDDGIEKNHPDLAQNYDSLASYDVNGNDHDPTPRYDTSNENKYVPICLCQCCCWQSGIRMLDGDVTDMVEAKSLGIRPDYIDIYSASWGPDDDGKTVDGPGLLAKQAFEMGIKKGNGGRQGDHCSCDGYTNSIYTISISSTTENGNKPWYLEECASTLATTYSSGEFYDRKIVTTDLRQRCTEGHTGTSVSAPMVAGVIALALEANPLITWRDVQHLLVKTSRPVHLKAPDWKTNAAGRRVSHLYGFGLVDAEAMVVEAKKWRSVPPQHICTGTSDRRPRYIRPEQSLKMTVTSTGCSDHAEQHVVYVEHVVVRVSIVHPRRGDLQVNLVSPSGTKSQLLAKRTFDNSNDGFKNWEFLTVHCWGEKAEGEWTLEIFDSPSQLRNPESLGPGKEECIQCARDFLQQEWKCVPACTEGYYPGEASGLPQRLESSSTFEDPDPGLNIDQNDARRAAWLRMQDQMNADAEQYKAKLLEEEREKQEKEKLIEEEKRKQKIKKWESMQEGTSYQGHTKVTQPETREPTTAVKRRRDKKPLRQNDPSTVVRRQEALDASRRRMQEELDAKAEQYKEKQKQLEEEKRRQKIEMWESMQEGKSYKGNTKLSQQQSTEESSSTSVLKPKSGKKPLRSGFNPLSGEGGGACSYRPGRRGPSSGG
ncbi:UNVERIFIED_CONTAM: hypothetical protein FKN15_004129 [Acipenser sinensis]